MRRYSREDELRVLLQRSVRDWAASGLLRSDQIAQLEPELRASLRRTGLMLRLGLALFTAIAVGAVVVLTFITLDIREDLANAIIAGALGVACFAAADSLVGRLRLYRYGVEEALVVASVALVGVSAGLATMALYGSTHDLTTIVIGFATCAAMSAFAYWRFGFQYAAIASMVFAALIPLQFRSLSFPEQRLFACAACVAAFLVARWMRLSGESEVRTDDATTLQASALIGMYLTLNIHADVDVLGILHGATTASTWFRWTTYVLTWVIPASGIWLGIADRDRKLMNAGLVTALGSLLTNKLYLGIPRQTWDPMLLGVLLIGVALVIRRWLASGPGGQRHGFTPLRVLHSEGETIRIGSIASAAVQPATQLPSAPQPTQFSGGRSGGAGGGGEF